jgi:hypothetical protein
MVTSRDAATGHMPMRDTHDEVDKYIAYYFLST